MFWSPTIVCRSPDCKTPIRLPYPNLLETRENPPNWPTGGWKVVFVCPSCGHGHEYRALDVQWRQFPTPGPSSPQSSTICVCCEFECAHKNCAIRARHYTLAESGTPDLEVLSRCLNSKCYPLCGEGEFATDYSAEKFLRVLQQWQIGPVTQEKL
jgi:hypothetical protein